MSNFLEEFSVEIKETVKDFHPDLQEILLNLFGNSNEFFEFSQKLSFLKLLLEIVFKKEMILIDDLDLLMKRRNNIDGIVKQLYDRFDPEFCEECKSGVSRMIDNVSKYLNFIWSGPHVKYLPGALSHFIDELPDSFFILLPHDSEKFMVHAFDLKNGKVDFDKDKTTVH